MITTKFECDKCKKAQDNNKDMFILAIGVVSCPESGYSYINVGNNNVTLRGLWCKECCDKHGVGLRAPPNPSPITFEDLVMEMVEAALENRSSN